MKAIEILEAISTKIKEGEYVGNIGIIAVSYTHLTLPTKRIV